MTRVVARPQSHAVGLWALFVAAAALLAARPGDPGPIPTGWLLVLAVLGVLAVRGSRLAWASLAVLNAILLAGFFLLAWPVQPQLWAFYGLVAGGLVALVGVPLLAHRRTLLGAPA